MIFLKARPWPKGAIEVPRVQGHRGFWKEGAQENTLASFRAAKARGLEMCELDVHLSKDQVPVVFHDYDLKRLGGGDQRFVHDCTVSELAQIANVCTLEQVFTDPDVPSKINVELKTNKAFDGLLEWQVAAVVKKTKVESRILFSSFNPMSLARISRLLPDVPRALLVTQENDSENKIYLKKMWLAFLAKPHLLHLDHRFVTKKEMQMWKDKKIPVAFWTVNEALRARELLKWGAFSLITDTLTQKDL
jgi:glycerophosphoryl diester phosphodiesterase